MKREVNMEYMYPIVEHQRVLDSISGELYTDISVVHVYQDDGGLEWGCCYPTRGQVIKTKIPAHKEIDLFGELVTYDEKIVTKFTGVVVEGPEWMSVHRTGDNNWIKEPGTDAPYKRALNALGIHDHEFIFDKANKIREPHHNEIPLPPAYKPIPVYQAQVTMTLERVIHTMSDGWTDAGQAWFGTPDSYVDCLQAIQKRFPTQSIVTAPAMGYDEESASKTKRRMGWYIAASPVIITPKKKRSKKS
jgi:hypothetical protein